MKTIYLDNGASTMVDPRVVMAMMPYFSEIYGNASSTHDMGMKARIALNDARHVIARAIGAKDDEIYFTSGGSESNNLAIKGVAVASAMTAGRAGKKEFANHIITTKVEHACVLNSCKWLEEMGFSVTYLGVDKEGFVDLKELTKAIRPGKAGAGGKTFLVSIIHGNNEIGTVNDLKAIGDICKKHGVLFHTDACQSFTKVPIDVVKMNVDLLTLNSHKIHGPKGVGALYVRRGIEVLPQIHGGGHEKGLRGGTENISGIVGFAEAVRLAKESHVKDMAKLRDIFIDEVLSAVPDAKLNGPREKKSGFFGAKFGSKSSAKNSAKNSVKRLCNNINITFPVSGEMLGDYLGFAGICTSKGSACASNESVESTCASGNCTGCASVKKAKTSHVLKAIGRTDKEAGNSIRFSISRFTTRKEIEETIDVLVKSVGKARKSRFA